jgi:hypothetical protein
MALRTETIDFLHKLEQSSNRKLYYPDEVGHLLEAARQSQQMAAFEEALFLAKFVSKSFGVMRRIGVDGEGFDKLSSEFEASLRKVSSLLKEISDSSADDIKREQEKQFFGLNPDSLDRLVNLMADLAILKNWTLDGKPLP